MPTSGALPRFSIHLSERIVSQNLSHPEFMALFYHQTSNLLASTTSIISVLTLYVISLLSCRASSQWSQSFEFERDISPAWRFVAKHFRWTNQLQNIADGYLRRIFKVPDNEPIPPVSGSYLAFASALIISQYIAIHARRANDFIVYCGEVPKDQCFPSISTYRRRIEEIQDETRERLGVVPQHVIMLSDEQDPAWWDSLRAEGWYTPDHVAEDTVNKHGRW